MKIYLLLAILLFQAQQSPSCYQRIFGKSSENTAQSGLGTAKNPVEQLLTLCKEDNLKEAAKHLRYPGMDQSKKDKTADYESGDADEKRQIEMSCKRFKAMANVTYTVSPERMEQGFYVYDVEIKESSKSNKQLWAFKKTGNDYVLADID